MSDHLDSIQHRPAFDEESRRIAITPFQYPEDSPDSGETEDDRVKRLAAAALKEIVRKLVDPKNLHLTGQRFAALYHSWDKEIPDAEFAEVLEISPAVLSKRNGDLRRLLPAFGSATTATHRENQSLAHRKRPDTKKLATSGQLEASETTQTKPEATNRAVSTVAAIEGCKV